MTITYEYEGALYVNLTNKCNCNCEFCLRHGQAQGSIYTQDSLWLEREPTRQEALDSFLSRDVCSYREIVFCGYGEPTYRIDDIVWLVDQLKERFGDKLPPVRITTKDKNLFNKNDEKIIAYGEWDLTGETQGTDGGLLEFEIPLDYRSLDRIPTYIVIVASASKYGDYFTGSTGSTMWIDDLELIYE